MSNYRYPNVTAADARGQLEQLKSYLRQLVDQLNAQSSVSASNGGQSLQSKTAVLQKGADSQAASFDEIKSLIIKSSEIADAFYEAYSKKLVGMYVAQSDFGSYTNEVATELAAAAGRIDLLLTNLESIQGTSESFADSTREQIAEIQAMAGTLKLQFETIQNNGVDRVVTAKGYTFDDKGLKISDDQSEITNLLDNTGMYVKRGEEVVLQANNKGVQTGDVTVRERLKIGGHAIFEDYNNGTGSGRTACFWMGG